MPLGHETLSANDPTTDEPTEAQRSDWTAVVLMLLGALAAIVGFGFLFSLWWRTGIQNDLEVLQIASREFASGRPIVAGKLAETVVFDEHFDDGQDPQSENASSLDGDGDSKSTDAPESRPRLSPIDPAEQEFEADRRETMRQKKKWSTLRDFLVGIGRVVQANELDDPRERRRVLFEAVPFLRSSQKMGFPLGQVAQGYRVLGESLFHIGEFDEAVSVLETAIEKNPLQRRELRLMLAKSQLRASEEMKDQSLETIENYLSDPALLPTQRWEAELVRMQTLMALGRWRELTESIQRESQEQQGLNLREQQEYRTYTEQLNLLKAEADVTRAIKRYGRYGELKSEEQEDRNEMAAELADAIELLQELQRQASFRLASRAKLWLARAYLVQGRTEEALRHLTAVSRQRSFNGDSIAGGLEEIELFAHQGRGTDLLDMARYLIQEMEDSRGFDPSVLTMDKFQQRLMAALDQLRERKQYEEAIDAARSLAPVFDPLETLTQEALGLRQWAAETIAEGTNLSGQVSRFAQMQARSRYRAAGDAFAKAAELRFETDDYLPTQWSAIEAYQDGRHFSQSIRLLEPYLRYEKRIRLPRGLVAYGRALLAENDPEPAIEALTNCIIEYPRDPLRYDARLLAAQAYAEKGSMQDAKRLLQDNLRDGELTPQSPAWRDSLLTLGELLYQQGNRNYLAAEQAKPEERLQLLRDNQSILEEAIVRLDEAVERYWPIARAKSAAYLAARARVMASTCPRIESQLPETLDAARRPLRRQGEKYLQQALEGFVDLHRYLSQQQEEQRLRDNEQLILRNCMLAEADVLSDLNRWEEAADAYRAVELKYMNEPSALEAILGRFACAKKMGLSSEAERLIRQANVVLNRIPADLDNRFSETTRYDRRGWEQFLGWMNQRLNAGGV